MDSHGSFFAVTQMIVATLPREKKFGRGLVISWLKLFLLLLLLRLLLLRLIGGYSEPLLSKDDLVHSTLHWQINFLKLFSEFSLICWCSTSSHCLQECLGVSALLLQVGVSLLLVRRHGHGCSSLPASRPMKGCDARGHHEGAISVWLLLLVVLLLSCWYFLHALRRVGDLLSHRVHTNSAHLHRTRLIHLGRCCSSCR